MAKFNYTLPSGNKFVLNAPSGTTQSQADIIFYTQVAAGSLVGYEAGQTLSSPVTKLTSFELSREERGTAGVPDSTILALISGAPIVAPVPVLSSVPITNPIDGADYALVNKDSLGQTTVGPLDSEQVQALLAQVIKLVDQPADEVSNDKGIGEYGFNVPQLEQAGYIKPGTYDTYLADDPEAFITVLNSPEVWTGLNGVNSLDDILTNVPLQNQIQTEIMQNSYDSLTSAGVIQAATTQPVSLNKAQVYSNASGGLVAASALTVLGVYQNGAPTALANSIVNASSNTSSNVGGLSTTSLSAANNLLRGALASLGLSTTVNSSSTSFNTLSTASINNLGTTLDKSSLTTTVAGDVGALVNNSSIFGTGLTALWAKGTNISGLATTAVDSALIPNIGSTALGLRTSLNTLTSTGFTSFGGVTDNLPGTLKTIGSGALGSLTPIVQNSLGSITAQARSALGPLTNNMNIFGSMSQYSVNFSGFSSGSLVSSTQAAPGYTNTVSRDTVNNAMAKIIGNPKVPVPVYGINSTTGTQADILTAQRALQQLSGAATQLAGDVTRAVTNAAGTATTSLFG